MNYWEVGSPRQQVKSGHSTVASPKEDSFMSTSSYFQNNSTSGRSPQVSSPNDQTIMSRYVLVCLELERVKKLIERQSAVGAHQTASVPADYQLLKLKEQSRNKQVTHFKQELERLYHRIRELEELAKEKERMISAKDEQLRAARQQLAQNALGVSKAQANQRNRIRELQNQLVFERSKIAAVSKRKDDIEAQLKDTLGKEQSSVRGALDYENKIRTLEQELRELRLSRDKEAVRSQHVPDSLMRKELEQIRTKMNEYKFDADRNRQAADRLRQLEIEGIKLRREHQQAVNHTKVLEIQLRNRSSNANAQEASKNLVAESEVSTLKRTVSVLESKLQNISSNLSVRERELQLRAKQNESLTQINEGLKKQVNEFMRKQASTPYQQTAIPEKCRNCATYQQESASYQHKISGLERELRQFQLKPPRPHGNPSRKTDTVVDRFVESTTEGPPVSGRPNALSDLLLSAQQLKNSNTRVNQLLETSQYSVTKLNTSRSYSRGSRSYRPRYH